jgi:hypothetical protein
MKVLSQEDVRTYLGRNGVSSPVKVEEILRSFDWRKAVYEQLFWPGDTLVTLDAVLRSRWRRVAHCGWPCRVLAGPAET